MNDSLVYTIQIISTLSIVPAIAIGLWRLRQWDKKYQWLLVFFGLGLLVDLLGWYLYLAKNAAVNLYLQFIYHLAEALFWIWFLEKLSVSRIVKFLLTRAWVLLLPLWSLIFFYPNTLIYFDLIADLFIAFVASVCVLQFVESRPALFRSADFWICLGAFFYFFGVFIIKGSPLVQLSTRLWYLHNLVGITANLIYFYGLLSSRIVHPSVDEA